MASGSPRSAPSTGAALEAAGVSSPIVVADDRDASGLAAAMRAGGVRGATVWFPVGRGRRQDSHRRAAEAGATVNVQPSTGRSCLPSAPERIRAALTEGIDAVTLTSGSTARHLAEALGGSPLPGGVRIVCIGDADRAGAGAAGLTVHAVATEPRRRGSRTR